MILWTHHPSSFRLDDPNLQIDHTKGKFWNSEQLGFRYREALPKLQLLVKTDQFLWCCTTRGCFVRTTEEIDLVEWELDVPASQVLRFHDVQVWEDIVWSRGDDWDSLLIDGAIADVAADKGIGALVRVPVDKWATCHGPPEPQRRRRKQP